MSVDVKFNVDNSDANRKTDQTIQKVEKFQQIASKGVHINFDPNTFVPPPPDKRDSRPRKTGGATNAGDRGSGYQTQN